MYVHGLDYKFHSYHQWYRYFDCQYHVYMLEEAYMVSNSQCGLASLTLRIVMQFDPSFSRVLEYKDVCYAAQRHTSSFTFCLDFCSQAYKHDINNYIPNRNTNRIDRTIRKIVHDMWIWILNGWRFHWTGVVWPKDCKHIGHSRPPSELYPYFIGLGFT